MNRAAHVTSLDAISQFRQALAAFSGDVHQVIDELMLELQRALEWIEQDRTRYWPAQARRASDAVAEARVQLERKQLTIDRHERPSCYEEKKALQRAVERLRYCEEQVRVTRHWLLECQRQADRFRTKLSKLRHFLDQDVVAALARLEHMSAVLNKYVGHSLPAAADPLADEGAPMEQPILEDDPQT